MATDRSVSPRKLNRSASIVGTVLALKTCGRSDAAHTWRGSSRHLGTLAHRGGLLASDVGAVLGRSFGESVRAAEETEIATQTWGVETATMATQMESEIGIDFVGAAPMSESLPVALASPTQFAATTAGIR